MVSKLLFTFLDSSLVKKFDLITFLLVIAITGFGLATLYSATLSIQVGESTAFLSSNFNKQVVWVSIGFVILFVVNSLNLDWISKLSYSSYILSIFLLILVITIGYVAGGARSWFNFGVVRFQPAEVMKIALILTLARFLTDKNHFDLKLTAMICVMVILPFGLIMLQPDLGSGLALIAISLPMIFWAGFPLLILFLLATPIVSVLLGFLPIHFLIIWCSIVGMVTFFFSRLDLVKKIILVILAIGVNFGVSKVGLIAWNSLKTYQQNRILTFLDPEKDPIGAGYQVLQSLTAIGSGGFWGKGYLEGTQTQLRFLPEQHTDFIFSVLAEEMGFIGVAVVLILFLFLCLRTLMIAINADDRFNSLVAIGIWGLLIYHIFINIGMLAGLMPVTGIPLPFFSYGGSFYLSMSVMMGLLIRVSR